MRKVIAAVMDISFVKYCGRPKGYFISKVKKFLIYDPKIVSPLDKKNK